MDRNSLLLLIIGYAGENGLSPVQLQKCLFLLGKEFEGKIENFYNFKPYNYGPFDRLVYIEAEEFADKGLVKFERVDGKQWVKYRVAEKGLPEFEKNKESVEKKMNNYLAKLVPWVQSLSFRQLVSVIYKHYPEYQVNSLLKKV